MTSPLLVHSHSEIQTEQLGKQLANALVPGQVVALNGELGAGKTNLVRAVCKALGVDENLVNSPTFILMQSYPGGRIPVVHFDTYRLGDLDEFLAIGGDEYLQDAETVCFVEWAARIEAVLPVDHVVINIEQSGESDRSFTIAGTGPASWRFVNRVRR